MLLFLKQAVGGNKIVIKKMVTTIFFEKVTIFLAVYRIQNGFVALFKVH